MKNSIRPKYLDYDWNQPFDPNEYCTNPKAIQMLYEETLLTSSKLDASENQIESLKSKNSDLKIENALQHQEIDNYQHNKWFPFLLQLIAVIGIGIGVNFVTASNVILLGWILIGISTLLEVVAFVFVKSKR